jgi:translation initiation factor 2 gamma subunit (eIF-2gamma)
MTAVEWLEEQLQKTYIFNQNDFDMFKKAKEMEKQQIIEAFKRGTINEMNGIEEIGSEQYYNETFKKDLVI